MFKKETAEKTVPIEVVREKTEGNNCFAILSGQKARDKVRSFFGETEKDDEVPQNLPLEIETSKQKIANYVLNSDFQHVENKQCDEGLEITYDMEEMGSIIAQ